MDRNLAAILKREEFAVSLRASKKKDILKLKRRKNIDFHCHRIPVSDIEARAQVRQLLERFNSEVIRQAKMSSASKAFSELLE